MAGLVSYSTDRRLAVNLVTLTVERAKEVAALNAAGEKPLSLVGEEAAEPRRPIDLAEQDDLTRFDKGRRRNARPGKRNSADKPSAPRRERGPKGDNREPQEERAPREQRTENRRARRDYRDKGNSRQGHKPGKDNREQQPPSKQE